MTTEYAWRIPCLLQLVGPVLILAATSTIPESPRVSVLISFNEMILTRNL